MAGVIFTQQNKVMRSLIKMEVNRYPVAEVSPKLPFNKPNSIRKIDSSTRPFTQNKRNSVYTPNTKHSVEEENFDFLRSQKYRQQYGNQSPTQQKKFLQNFISGLTKQIENPNGQPGMGQVKLNVLKKIIEKFDIKSLEKQQYSRLIKTFGLQIESAKKVEKLSSLEFKQRNICRTPERNFDLRSSHRNRFAKLKNRITNDNHHQVALLEFSQELIPSKIQKPKFVKRQLKATSKNIRVSLTNRQSKLRVLESRQQSSKKQLKVSPVKCRPKHDSIIQKINKYKDFLYCLNYSNHLYRDLDLINYQKPIKYYIGPGNNSNMIRSLMKKRHWFEQTSSIKEANFVWTQLKVNTIFNQQTNNKFYRAEIKGVQGKAQVESSQLKKIKKSVEKMNKTLTFFARKTDMNQQNIKKILTNKDAYQIIKFKDQLTNRNAPLNTYSEKLKLCDKKLNRIQISQTDQVHNHLPSNGILGNKKGLFYCMKQYYQLINKNVWNVLPMTFHISNGSTDPEYQSFLEFYRQRQKNKRNNVWIMKPGEFSNRGNGISCSNKLEDIRKRVMKCQNFKRNKQTEKKTVILQLYITNPLLYNNRKFDLRVFMLTTCHNGKIKGYWYQDGYVRTSSFQFDLSQIGDNDIHLTNDAVQKQTEFYGKYQPGNKLSFGQLQRYLDSLPAQGRNLDIASVLIPKMKSIASQALKSSFLFLDEDRKENNFEIFGMDFMVDYNFNPWLIQINTNPCLELSCPLLERIIPYMVENSLRIAVDTLLPPPNTFPNNYKYNIPQNAIYYNKYELIFDEDRDGGAIRKLFEANHESMQKIGSLTNIEEQKQIFEEEGILCEYDI